MIRPDGAAIWRVVRFGVVGLASNTIGYLAYLALTSAGTPPKLTMTALYATASGLAFFGNRRFTFGDGGRVGPAAIRFAAVAFAGWGLNLALLVAFVDGMGQPHWLVQGVAILIVAAFLYVMQRRFVFRPAPDRRST